MADNNKIVDLATQSAMQAHALLKAHDTDPECVNIAELAIYAHNLAKMLSLQDEVRFVSTFLYVYSGCE